MASDPAQPKRDDPIEFEDVTDDDGQLTARHKPTGGTISGKTRDQLERRAAGTRIGTTLRRAAEELRKQQRGRT